MATLPQLPNIVTRFSYQGYNPITKKLKLGAEFLCDVVNQRVFAMNVRFFFDATFFLPGSPSTVNFVDFAPGYGKHSPIVPYFGTGQAGKAYFNLPTTPVTYVNGAMSIVNINEAPILVSTDPTKWTRLFSIELTTKNVLVNSNNYPAVIWDREPIGTNGSFLTGNAGNVVTVVEDPSGVIKTAPTLVTALHFNWNAVPTATKAPWGSPVMKTPVGV